MVRSALEVRHSRILTFHSVAVWSGAQHWQAVVKAFKKPRFEITTKVRTLIAPSSGLRHATAGPSYRGRISKAHSDPFTKSPPKVDLAVVGINC